MRPLLLAAILLSHPAIAMAQNRCQASNTLGEQCAATCPVPQAGVCVDGFGPEPPLCFCVGMEPAGPSSQGGGGADRGRAAGGTSSVGPSSGGSQQGQ